MIYRVIMDGNDILDYEDKDHVLLSPQLNTELNTAGAFEFTMPPEHALYGSVQPLLSTIEVYEDEDMIWFGRPVEIKTDFWKQRLVYCEGALAFFNDSVQRPHEYDSISLHTFFRTVIANHNAQVAASRRFTVGQITVTDKSVYRKLRYESTFDVLKRQCLNAEGGYLFVRRIDGVNYIDWLAEMPYSCNQPVEFGLNLLDITSGFDGSSIATCVVPLGDTDSETGEELTVASVNGGSDTIESEAVSVYGRITKAVTFSGVKEAATLYRDGVEYLQNTQFNNLVIECSAAELHSQNANFEQFRVGQMIRCHSIPHLVDREFPLTKLSLRLDTAAKQITLGNLARQSLTRIYKEDKQEEESEDNPLAEEIEALGERIDGLEDLIEEIPGIDIGDLEEAISDLQTDLDDSISGLHTDLDDAISGIQTDLGDAISGIQTDLDDAISGLQTDFGDAISGVQGDISDLSDLVNGIVDGSNDGWGHWFGTASEYQALGTYDNHTIYYIQSSETVDDYFIYEAGSL